jgi:mRNA-degrading endonuclease RelE of RelBE toxin-antitoxin system
LGERKIFVSPAFDRKIKKLKKQEKKELDDAVLDLLNDPSVAEEKVGDLAGVSVYKFKINKQLVLLSYTYDENEINLLTFGSHENFYRDLKKYKKA